MKKELKLKRIFIIILILLITYFFFTDWLYNYLIIPLQSYEAEQIFKK